MLMCVIGLVLVAVALYQMPKDRLLGALVPLVLLMLICVWGYLVNVRTFIFDEDGCIIILPTKKRVKYSWDELKTKRIQPVFYPSKSAVIGSYAEAAVFAVDTINPKKLKNPIGACYPWNWTKICCVNFIPKRRLEPEYIEKKQTVEVYGYSKEEFMEKMREWGVELEVVTKL